MFILYTQTEYSVANKNINKESKQKLKKMEKFEALKQLIAEIEADVTKFYEKGNKSAGTRIRKAMQQVKATAQEIRVNVQETKNAAE